MQFEWFRLSVVAGQVLWKVVILERRFLSLTFLTLLKRIELFGTIDRHLRDRIVHFVEEISLLSG